MYPTHVTQRGTNRERVFHARRDFEVYEQLLRDHSQPAGLRVLAYCLMPNHIHLIGVPDQHDALAVALRRTHGRFAQYLNARLGRSGHLWQNRFFSCALGTFHLWTALRYVERNPVRAALVSFPGEHPWSSARAHLTGEDRTGTLDMDFWHTNGGAANWAALLAEPDELTEIKLLRRCTHAGAPIGSSEFLDFDPAPARSPDPSSTVRRRRAGGGAAAPGNRRGDESGCPKRMSPLRQR